MYVSGSEENERKLGHTRVYIYTLKMYCAQGQAAERDGDIRLTWGYTHLSHLWAI